MNGRLLESAKELINGKRQDEYGKPEASFSKTALFWSAYLGVPISAKDVCVLMCLLKLARESFWHKRDNLLDAAGYIGLAQDMEQHEREKPYE